MSNLNYAIALSKQLVRFLHWSIAYPPPINDSTPYTVNCDSWGDCYGTNIKCPDNAQCDIICNAPYSCEDSVIYCPSTAPCNIQCKGRSACRLTTVKWPTNANLANLTSDDQYNYIQQPTMINAPNNNEPYTFNCNLI